MRTALDHLLAILLLEIVGTSVASAMSVESVDIARIGDAYSVTFEVIIAANVADVRRMLTNYREWPRLSDSITESRLVDTVPRECSASAYPCGRASWLAGFAKSFGR